MIKKKYLIKIVLLISLIAFINGFTSNIILEYDHTFYINDFIFKSSHINQSLTLHNSLFIILVFILSLSVFGLLIVYIIYYLEIFSIGYTFALFIKYYKVKGFLFYLLFFLIFKFVFVFLFTYFIVMSSKFSKYFLRALVSKNDRGLIKRFQNHFVRFILILMTVLIYSSLVQHFSVKIVSFLVALFKL